MKDTVRINFEFPREHYPYLKMVCAMMGISLKDFASQLIINEIEAYEDQLLAKKAQKRLDDMNESENISIKEAFGQDQDAKNV